MSRRPAYLETFYTLLVKINRLSIKFCFLFLTKEYPKGIPHRWQESGSLGLPGNYGVGLIPPLQGGSPEPPLFGICLLYTSDAAGERSSVDLGGRRIIKKKRKKKE